MYERTPASYTPIFPSLLRENSRLTHYLERMRGRMVEGRLAKNIVDEEGNVVAEGVEMLNRQGALYYLCQWISHHPAEPYTIQTFDIRGFKNLDRIENGYNLADFKLNQLARELHLAAAKSESLSGQPTFVGRYGGDEFILVSVGPEALDYRDTLQQNLYNAVAEVGLQTKNGIEEVSPPTDPARRKIFEGFLRRNLLLNETELERTPFSPELFVPDQALSPTRLPRQNDFAKTLRKVRYRIQNNGESERLEQDLSHFYRQVIIRPGVQHEILNLNSFEQQLISNTPHQLWALDLKFIKEINDGLSYVEGDRLINQILVQITELFPAHQIGRHVFIGCRGGLIIVGFSKRARRGLDGQSKVKFREFMNQPTRPVRINGVEIDLPVGVSYQVTTDTRQTYRNNFRAMQQYPGGLTARVVRHLLQEGINGSESNWYERILSLYTEYELSRGLLDHRLNLLRRQVRLTSAPLLFAAFLCGTDAKKMGRLPARYAVRFERIIAGAKRRGYSKLVGYLEELRETSLDPAER